MVASIGQTDTHRKMERMERASEESSSKADSPKKKPNERRMDMDAYAEASQRNRTQPKFGAFAAPTSSSINDQYDRAIGEAQAEGAKMKTVQQAANAAYRSVPVVSRGAEVITGGAAAIGTVANLAGSAVESAVRQDSKPLDTAVQDAYNSMAWAIGGELTGKIERARGLYQQFASQYGEYAKVNQDYQAALRNQDHAAISRLAARKEQLVGQIKNTVARLEAAVRDVGAEDKRFEHATVHAAEHLAMSAVMLGVGGATHGFDTPMTVVGGAKDVAKDVALGQAKKHLSAHE